LEWPEATTPQIAKSVEPVGAVHRSYLSKKLTLAASATYEHYSDDIKDSPIARQSYEYKVGLSLVYHF
jgi:outer membrane scaffolding protein for murein synthesis (MipA/OmpV family)